MISFENYDFIIYTDGACLGNPGEGGWAGIIYSSKENHKKIVVAGLTYKPDVSDLRNSFAVEIFKKLKRKFSNIIAYDPFVNEKILKNVSVEKNFHKVKNAGTFIFLVKHKIFKNLYSFAKKNNKIVIDPFA